MEIWGATDQGNVRKQNQDYYRFHRLGDSRALAVVCDGMGGAKSGDVASKLASDVFLKDVCRSWEEAMTQEETMEVLRSAVQLANKAVFEQSQEGSEFSGMGTTLVAVLLDGKVAYVINVGDSRCYQISGSNITQVTEDHSIVSLMVQRGQITAEEAKKHPQKNLITRAVGTEPDIRGDGFRVEVGEDDYLLLCSDGLSNQVSDPEILYELVHGGDDESCCQRLIEIAKNRGAPDNVTVVLLKR